MSKPDSYLIVVSTDGMIKDEYIDLLGIPYYTNNTQCDFARITHFRFVPAMEVDNTNDAPT